MFERNKLTARTSLIALACIFALIFVFFLTQKRPIKIPPSPRQVAVQTVLQPEEIGALPAVEPLVVRDLPREDAVAQNSAVPFVRAPNPPAKPFIFRGPAENKEGAITCLASAAWYEAGGDVVGQEAVVQVVLNRLRHPVYPKSVCGVVFQGSERKTGCQFSFTCDGSLVRRRPPTRSWDGARFIAEKALAGFVFKQIGTATHYHTNWVVPYWSSSLDKITEVHTHLFFRWQGWWGTPAAFTGTYKGPENVHPQILYLARGKVAVAAPFGSEALPENRMALAAPGTPSAPLPGVGQPMTTISAQELIGNKAWLADPASGEFVLHLDPKAYPGTYATVALRLCLGIPNCTVMGWIDPKRLPVKLPVDPTSLRSASFVYRKNAALSRDSALWNCQQIVRELKSQCLPGTAKSEERDAND